MKLVQTIEPVKNNVFTLVGYTVQTRRREEGDIFPFSFLYFFADWNIMAESNYSVALFLLLIYSVKHHLVDGDNIVCGFCRNVKHAKIRNVSILTTRARETGNMRRLCVSQFVQSRFMQMSTEKKPNCQTPF